MTDIINSEEWLAEQLQDPAVRAEWERTAVARAVAIWLIGYRADRNWSIEELAARLGRSVDEVTELEVGEQEPSVADLLQIARALHQPLRLEVERGLPGDGFETVVIGGTAEVAA